MAKQPEKRVTALREVSAPWALPGQHDRRLLFRWSSPCAHAEFLARCARRVRVACRMCCAKALFELHPCVLRHICSKECSAYAGYRVIDLHTDPDGMLQQWRNSLTTCVSPPPFSCRPTSRSPTTLESDLTIAFRIDLRSSFVHLLVRHDRATAAAILEPAAPG